MNSTSSLKPKTLEKILYKKGFTKIKEKGGHALYKADNGRITSLPLQRGRNLALPLVKEILKEIQITETEFNTLLTETSSKS